MEVGGERHAPAALPPGKTRHPLYRTLGGPQDPSGRVRKISPPPGFHPRTVQPVASRCTDWAIPAHWVPEDEPPCTKHFWAVTTLRHFVTSLSPRRHLAIAGQSMRGLWRTQWRLDRFVSEFFGFPRLSFPLCSIHKLIRLSPTVNKLGSLRGRK